MARRVIPLNLSEQSINSAIKELRAYKEWVARKTDELCERLAEIGATKVSIGYARAIYSGDKDIAVTVEKTSNGYSIMANGESVFFVEFGAGATYGYGHPEAKEHGMGPGTYPDGKGHWDDPSGWWSPRDHGGGHTYGNPPNPVMYETGKELGQMVLEIAKEVFAVG